MISFRHCCSKLNTFNVLIFFCHIKDWVCNFTTSDPKPRLCLQSFVSRTQSANSFVLYQAFLASLSVHGRLEHRISTTNYPILLLLFMWFLEVKPKVVFQTFKVNPDLILDHFRHFCSQAYSNHITSLYLTLGRDKVDIRSCLKNI